ncbi:MAG: NAD-dependent epimerase/dehydratase family protein [Bacteroidales bacterium]|nr:NAD-dependent epimerase/dehydratase family protein [Bacteroidales bacterium]
MILLTGGTGLLGSHLLLSLAREQKEIVALKRPSSGLEEVRRVFGYHCANAGELEELWGRIRWIDADLLNQVDMTEVLEGVQQVYHCAGMVSFQPRDRQKMIRFNTDSTSSVVAACLAAGVQKLLHVSSTSAIGRPAEGSPATESLIWAHSKTGTGYALSKFRSEMEVWRGIEEGLNAVIVNPAIILGPGFWDRGSSSMFSRVDGGLKYAAPGVTGYVGISDVVSAMIRLMESDISGERFILSEGNYSYQQVFGKIAQALGKTGEFREVTPSLLRMLVRLDFIASVFRGSLLITTEHVRAAFGEVRFSSDKVKEALGMDFTPLEQVIAGVAEHYRKEFP